MLWCHILAALHADPLSHKPQYSGPLMHILNASLSPNVWCYCYVFSLWEHQSHMTELRIKIPVHTTLSLTHITALRKRGSGWGGVCAGGLGRYLARLC